jgi:maleamate amidohydrolase
MQQPEAMSPALDPKSHPAYAAECGDPSRTKNLGFGTRPALLLVDVCEAYYAPSSPLVLSDSTLGRATAALSQLVQAVRNADSGLQPQNPDATQSQNQNARSTSIIIHTQTLYTHPHLHDAGILALKTAPSITALFHSHNPAHLAHAPAAHPELAPQGDDLVLHKKYPSPFFGTNLATQLAALGVDTLVIAGFTTSSGVRAAALDAMQAGFRPMVVAEACADRGEETHWANLMDMGAKYGDIISVESAVETLQTS